MCIGPARACACSYDDLVQWLVEEGSPGTKVTELEFEGKAKCVYYVGL